MNLNFSFDVIKAPFIKLLVFILITFSIYSISKLTILVSDVFDRYCSIKYEVSQPVYSNLTSVYFNQYYLENIFPLYKKNGIKYYLFSHLRNEDCRYFKERKREFFIFSFDKKILNNEEVQRFDKLIKDSIKQSYAFALKTELYYQYIQRLYSKHGTGKTMSLEEIYLKITKDNSYINKKFPSKEPFILISGPDVRTIPELHPVFREIILWIFSLAIATTFIIVWIYREKIKI